MAASSSRSLAEVQRRVSEVHRGSDPEQQLRFYDGWAPEYEQDVTVLRYQAPRACGPGGFYDAVLIVGALSEGQVPSSVIPELLRVTKPGGFLCLTTRNNQSNLQYKNQMQQLLDDLEQRGLWEKVKVQDVEQWERATSEQEAAEGSDYISGVVYLYRKTPSVSF